MAGSRSARAAQQLRQLHDIRLPATVDKHAGEGRGSCDLADQPILVGRISGGNLHRRSLLLRTHRIDREMVLQDALASGVDDPGGRPDLGVAVRVDIVHQEIDQPTLFLEHRKEMDDVCVRTARLRPFRRRANRFIRRRRRGRLPAWLQKHPDQNQNRQRQRDWREVLPERLDDRNHCDRNDSRRAHRHEEQRGDNQDHSHCGMPPPAANALNARPHDYNANLAETGRSDCLFTPRLNPGRPRGR